MNNEDLLRDLPRETPPPPELEQRVVDALRARGLVRPRRRRWLPYAAAAAIFAIGFLIGQYEGQYEPPRPAPARSFALILHESPDHRGDSHVDEYIAWSRNDFVVGGHELADQSRVLGTAPASVGGFFLIAADSLDRAAEIARTCPHVRYGGTIEVREVVR
jgi:hypothetical protein